MPVNLSIKNVPDAVAARLRARAIANHRSLQRELMAIIEIAGTTPDAFNAHHESVSVATRGQRQARTPLRPIEEVLDEWRNLLLPSTGGPSSTEIIRAMRDERYSGARAEPPAKRSSR